MRGQRSGCEQEPRDGMGPREGTHGKGTELSEGLGLNRKMEHREETGSIKK